MPLFTVTTNCNRSIGKNNRPSGAIHAAGVAAGYPEDDLFGLCHSLQTGDFKTDPYYPAPPKPQSDPMLMIEAMIS
jgi:hypothetical protein